MTETEKAEKSLKESALRAEAEKTMPLVEKLAECKNRKAARNVIAVHCRIHDLNPNTLALSSAENHILSNLH